MGKKKNRQNSNMAVNVECTEPWDASNNQTADADDSCKHIAKVLKRLKNYENFKNSKENFGFCGFCKVSSQTDSKKSLQLCLSCGACTCGTDGENHALDHFKTPRSESHCLTIELESFSLWCFACNLEPVIPQKCRARIDEIKEKIKNVSEKHQTPRKPSSSGSSESKALNKNQFMASNKEDKRSLPALPNKVKVPDIPNKVKGLSNLGNTCFFNSVLQCLAQTPGLAECLREMRKGGEEISIVPKDSEPIRGTLEKGGPVSGCLLDLITEMTSESSPPNSYGKSVLVPRELMTELGKKCPQLMDGDQHDSHELLRQLLDVVFNEDLKRYRRIILKKYGLEKAKTDEVADEKRKWLKELDNLVPEQFVMKPYEVFRGTLVSELQCEECHNISSREENFLDLSLPVNVEKPLPPAFARRKLSQNNAMNGKLPCTVQCSGTADDNKVEDAKSPKRGNRRSMKRNFRDHGEGCITEEEKKENDADVEDNVEIGGDDQKEVFESGYSSEKPASSRTSPTTESRQNNGDADDSACASPSASMPSMPPMSTAVSAALANLAAVDQPAELTDSVKLPDTVSSNLPVANLLPYIESDNSSDSAGSLRANAAFSSPDLSTESICTGVLSQERSCGSDHDDSQSNDNITISKELESMANSQFIGTNFHQSTSTFYQSGDYNIGPITTAHDEPSCSPNEEFNKFESTLKALEVEEEEEEEKHMKQYEAKTSISRFDDSSQIENKVTNESGDFNCGLTITPIEGSSSAANEVCCNIDSETNLPCFNNASPNSRLTETNAENETDSFKSKLRALELQDVGKQHEYETERPCFHNSSSTETTEGKQSGAYNNVQTITALEENPYPINEESDKCDNLEQRLSEEDQADEIESKSLCCKNDSHDGYESLSNDEARNVCSRPSSRLEHVNSMARSSPVDVSNNSPLDGELVEKCLENIIFTEKLKSETANEEIERPSVPRAPSNINSDIAERKDQNSPPSNSGHLGFVLVGGITSTTNNDISRVESASIKEIPNSDTVRPTCNISNDECAEVSPELYKKNHMTLAPRYQCEEGECSVLSCLNHFTAIEMMAGNNKAGCDMCTKRQNKGKEKDAKTVYTNSTKRLLISKPPPILILHLKRFQVQMRSFRKLSCHVTFPLELDIAPFCSKSCEKLLEKGQTKLLYSLYGVVEHSGTLHGGHYVAYVKVREGEQKPNQPREGSWYYISDSQVSPVKEENVLRTQAYLLFYERIM